jgi:phenylacetate 2-hydroxylase
MSFGVGARACPCQPVAARVIYMALVRLLTSYRIIASEDEPPNTDYADYNQIKSALVAIPRDFKVKLVPRNSVELKECLRTSMERTEQYYVE